MPQGGNRIELPFPHKALWPNGRAHWAVKQRETRKHRQWAHDATLALFPFPRLPEGATPRLTYTIHPKTRHPIDKDNAIAATKSFQDGIAAALRIDDKTFAEPRIIFADPVKHGKVFAEIGG